MQKETHTKILNSAEKLFWTSGYKAASLDRIANDAGQSKGAIFHYFRNKQDIAKTALSHYAEKELFAPLETAMATNANVKEALLVWLESLYSAYTKNKYKGGCMLGNLTLELADQDESMRGELSKIFLNLENRLVGFFKEKAKEGQIVMENRQFARLLIATLQGITMTVKAHKDKNRAGREFQALGEMIERLVKG